MTFTIKPDCKFSYTAKIHEWKFQFVSASMHPQTCVWSVLGLGPDGEFYSFKKEHIKVIKPLELALG